MRKKRVLFASNYALNDTTSFLRAWGPFSLMQDEVEIVEPLKEFNSESQWWSNWRNWFNNIDVCFLHRPAGKIAACIMEEARIAGIPVWVDHDDHLGCIPESNPHFEYYKKLNDEFPGFDYSIKYADILTCSGKVMFDDIRQNYKREDVIHITTGLDDRLLRFKRPFNANQKVAWRGSRSHLRDLEVYKREISEIIRQNHDREFHFWGITGEELENLFNPPDEAKIYVSEASAQGKLNLLPFIKSLTDENCSIHFVVLEDNKFNRVKSNLAWLDATLAGSVVFAPRFPEFCLPGIASYENGEGLKQLFELKGSWRDQHYVSWTFIQDCLMTSKLNQKRLEILKNL